MRTQRYPDRLPAPDSERDPEMIDIFRHSIDFDRKGNWRTDHPDDVAVVQAGAGTAIRLLIASKRQRWRILQWDRGGLASRCVIDVAARSKSRQRLRR